MTGGRFRVGVLASGEGTNLQALLDRVHGRAGIEIVAVGSNQVDAPALARAAAAGVETAAFPAGEYADRSARDDAMAAWLRERGVDLVVLAGYMQLVTPAFLAAFPQRVINVHPALLPAFPGIGAVEQAIEYGVAVVGVTVHFVDEGVDSGPVILQRAIELPPGADGPAARQLLRPLEHDLLPRAVELLAAGAISFDSENPRRVVIDRALVPRPESLDHVQLAAPPGCEPAAREFFGELLGLSEIAKPHSLAASGGAWFRCGTQEIHVGVDPDSPPARKAHPALRLPHPEALGTIAQRLAGAGYPVDWDGRLPRHRRIYTCDPWGNRIELLAWE